MQAETKKKSIQRIQHEYHLNKISNQLEIKVIEIKQFKNLLWKKKFKEKDNKFKHNLQINCEYFQNQLNCMCFMLFIV